MAAMDPHDASPPAARAAEIAGCRAAHDRLLADLDGLTDDGARAPSALPGWSVGHVLSHLARNAEALANMVEGLAVGEQRPMYASAEARGDDIDAGSGRPAAQLVDEVRVAADALHAAWAALDEDRWAGTALTRGGPVPAGFLPMLRWREVEIHHADLGRPSFGWEDWSEGWVRADLPRLAALLAADEPGAARRLAAVLAGRLDGPVTLPTVLG
jgi:maleylpyruvate isomerase